jgi:hypothetical protein
MLDMMYMCSILLAMGDTAGGVARNVMYMCCSGCGGC